MKKAKKRAVSFILTITLAMAMFLAMPMSVFAAFPDLTFTTAPSTASVGYLQITGITNADLSADSYRYYENILAPSFTVGDDTLGSFGESITGFPVDSNRPSRIGYYFTVLELGSSGDLLNYGYVTITNDMLRPPTPGTTMIEGGVEEVIVSDYAGVTDCTLYLVPSGLYPSGGGEIDLNNSIKVTGDGAYTVPAGNYALFTVFDNGGFWVINHGSYVKGAEVTVTAVAGPGAPVLTSGSVGRTSDTTATVSFTSDSPGLYAWQLDGTAPSVVPFALSDPITMVVGTNTISLTGLTAGPHTIYIVARGANQILSETLVINIPGFTPGGSTSTPGSHASDVPQTGDSSNTQAWLFVLIGSLLGLCALTVLRKRLKADDQR